MTGCVPTNQAKKLNYLEIYVEYSYNLLKIVGDNIFTISYITVNKQM